jgi:hypothetical protein
MFSDNIDVNKMIEQQKAINADIASQPSELVNKVTVCRDEYYEDKVSKTNIVQRDSLTISLTRYINNRIMEVEFEADVSLLDVMQYFEVSDAMFVKCAKRPHIC